MERPVLLGEAAERFLPVRLGMLDSPPPHIGDVLLDRIEGVNEMTGSMTDNVWGSCLSFKPIHGWHAPVPVCYFGRQDLSVTLDELVDFLQTVLP